MAAKHPNPIGVGSLRADPFCIDSAKETSSPAVRIRGASDEVCAG